MISVRTVLVAAFLSTPLLAQFSQQGPKLEGSGADGPVFRGQAVAVSADGTTAIVGGYGDNGTVGAAWIFTRSGALWTQKGARLAADGAVGAARLGWSVALSADGSTAIVGGYGDSGNAGAAWVFIRTGDVYMQQAKLVGTGAVGSARQGRSVSISADGNTAIVGGDGDNGNAGAAWVFARYGESWMQEGTKLVGTGAVGSAYQGQSVSLSGDGTTAIVGGTHDNGGAGAAWAFTHSGVLGTWAQQGTKLVGTGAVGSAYQGQAVSLSGDGTTAIVGGIYDNGNAGAAWVYTRSGGDFTQLGTKLVGTGAVGSAFQGVSVSLSDDGNTAMVGGYFDGGGAGAAWVFTRSGGVFTQQGPKVVGTDAVGLAPLQGASVSLSLDGSTAIVGGYGDNDSAGAAWVFTRSAGVWTQQGAKLIGSGSARQGTSVSLSVDGNTAILGGLTDNVQTGAAWVFTRSGGVFTQQGSKLVGAGAAGSASQGVSVSLSADGNTAIVGGYEDGGNAGASWVFTRSGGVWTQQGAKLVGTGAVGAAYQGCSVSLSADGNTALVGGFGDAGNAGAAWVFTRSGGVWTQQGSKLVGTGAVGQAFQGYSVSLSADGNTALVGGYGDNGSAGAAWVFTRTGGVWTQLGTKLVGTGAVGSAFQGVSVSLSSDGNTSIVGGYFDGGGAGAAWVFTRSGGVFTQQGSKLVGGGAAGTALQGISVSLSANGNTAIVGGYTDDGSVGATWIFTRSGGSWTQQGSKLVGTGAVGQASQGASVALSGDGRTAIVGGPRDRAVAGAAWVFTTQGLRFHTVVPCRILDTRNAAGPLGGPPLQPGTSRSFPALASACGIPSTAKALSVNVTVTQEAAPGYLQMYAADQPAPVTSVISFPAGKTRANNAIVGLPADGSGQVAVFDASAGTVDFILDVNGYFQ